MEATTYEEKTEKNRALFNGLARMMKETMPKRADHVIGKFYEFYSSTQYIGWEAIAEKDLPCIGGIALNGIFMYFEVDFAASTVSVNSWGHISLSREESDLTRMAATGMKDVAKARGAKWMRRSKFKSLEDLHKRIYKAYSDVMEAVAEYTGGYPYKQGIGFVNPQANGGRC